MERAVVDTFAVDHELVLSRAESFTANEGSIVAGVG